MTKYICTNSKCKHRNCMLDVEDGVIVEDAVCQVRGVFLSTQWKVCDKLPDNWYNTQKTTLPGTGARSGGMKDNIKKEARKIWEGVFDSMKELDILDWCFIDDGKWQLGFRIDKDAPNKYSVRIAGDGIHYSKSLKGLRPHILKKIEQILSIKTRMEKQRKGKNDE